MKTYFIFFLLIVARINTCLGADEAPPPPTLTDYATLLKEQGNYAVSIADARIKWAQANGIEAQAAGKWIAVQFLARAFQQYKIELNKANKLRYNLERQAETIEQRIKQFHVLLLGKYSPYAWSAYRYLCINVIPASAQVEALSIKIDPSGRTKENFEDAAFDFPGESVGELIEWLEKTKFSLRRLGRGSSWAAFAQAIELMSSPASAQLAKVKAEIASVRPESNTIWNPALMIDLVNGGTPVFQPGPNNGPPPIPAL